MFKCCIVLGICSFFMYVVVFKTVFSMFINQFCVKVKPVYVAYFGPFQLVYFYKHAIFLYIHLIYAVFQYQSLTNLLIFFIVSFFSVVCEYRLKLQFDNQSQEFKTIKQVYIHFQSLQTYMYIVYLLILGFIHNACVLNSP